MVRGVLVELIAEEGAQRKRVGAAAGNGALAGEVFEKADNEHLEVDGGVDAGAAAARRIGIGGAADFANALGKSDARERLIELAVEGAGGGLGEAFGFHPELRLGVLGGVAALEHARRGDKQDPCGFSTVC